MLGRALKSTPRAATLVPMALPTSRRHPRSSDALPLALLVVLVAGFFAPVLFGDRALLGVHTHSLSPWTLASDAPAPPIVAPLAADKTLHFDPQVDAALESLAEGAVPHWHDGQLFGFPLLAQSVHGIFHWPMWLGLVMPRVELYGWVTAIQTLIASIGMFLLARALHLDRWPAFLAAVLFAYCGYFSVRLHWFQIQGATVYLPWMIWGIERIFRGASWGTVATTAVAVGCSLLAGFPQGSVHALYAAGVWGVTRWAWGLRWRQPARPGRAILRCGLALSLGIAIGLPQLLPAFTFANSDASTRSSESPEVVRSFGMGPAGLLPLIAPHVLGHPQDLAAHTQSQLRVAGSLRPVLVKPQLTDNHHVETASTISIAGLMLAMLGLRWRHPGRALAAAIFFAGLILSFDTPLLLLVAHLPGLDQGDPRRLLSWVGFGGALLAAFGLARLMRDGPSVRFGFLSAGWAAITVVVAVAAHQISPTVWVEFVGPLLAEAYGIPPQEVFRHAGDLPLGLTLMLRSLDILAMLSAASAGAIWWARRKSGREAAGTVLVGLALFELLYLVAARELTTEPAASFTTPPPGLSAWTTAELGGGRVHRLLATDDGRVRRDALAYPLPPATGMPFGVRDVSGYIAMSMKRNEALHELIEPGSTFGVGIGALATPAALDDPLLDVMAVEKVIIPDDQRARLGDRALSPIEESPGLSVWTNVDALPRASLARGAFVVASREQAYEGLASRTFDPRVVTVIEMDNDTALRADTVPASRAAPPAPIDSAPGTVTWTRDDPGHVELDVDAARATWLVLADSWVPGWSATITSGDGTSSTAPVLPAQLAFRAVPVPAGRSTITLTFESPGWSLARLAALIALAITAVFSLLGLASLRS